VSFLEENQGSVVFPRVAAASAPGQVPARSEDEQEDTIDSRPSRWMMRDANWSVPHSR
jgi:hypothetical protein